MLSASGTMRPPDKPMAVALRWEWAPPIAGPSSHEGTPGAGTGGGTADLVFPAGTRGVVHTLDDMQVIRWKVRIDVDVDEV
jgi:hypothetical protein